MHEESVVQGESGQHLLSIYLLYCKILQSLLSFPFAGFCSSSSLTVLFLGKGQVVF